MAVTKWRPEPRAVEVAGQGGVPLNVWDYGGEGSPLLLCHCMGTVGRIWDPVIKDLATHFRVIAPDSRGHGDSGKPTGRDAYRWPNLGRDILAICDAFDLAPGVMAVGHSSGGAHLIHAELQRPGTFARLALIDAILCTTEVLPDNTALADATRQRTAEFESRSAARLRFSGKPPMELWDPAALDAYLSHGLRDLADGSVTLKCPPHVEAWGYELGRDDAFFEGIAQVQSRVLLITGSRSNIARAVAVQHERISGSGLHTVTGAGHFIPQEKPHEVAKLLLDWFRD